MIYDADDYIRAKKDPHPTQHNLPPCNPLGHLRRFFIVVQLTPDHRKLTDYC